MKKKITLLICGSIALSRAKSVYQQFCVYYDVNLLFTKSALKIFKNEFSNIDENFLNLINFEKFTISESDCVVVYAATYNTINKYVNKIVDTKFMDQLLNYKKQIIFVPAMNNNMYTSEIFQYNLNKLKSHNKVFVIEPIIGKLREGHNAIGHVADSEEIVITTLIKTAKFNLKNKNCIVASGAMKVNVFDSVNLTNMSSSTFAFYFVKVLHSMGANVTWIDNSLKRVDGVKKVFASTNVEMVEQSCKHLTNNSWYFSLTAGSDFMLKNYKINKQNVSLSFIPNIKIIEQIQKKSTHKSVKFIGFKLSNDVNKAYEILNKYNLEYVIWNEIETLNSKKVSGKIISKNKEIDFCSSKLMASYLIIKNIF